MQRIRAFPLPASLAGAATLAFLSACGDERPLGPDFIEVTGDYAVTFAATEATGCEGFVEPGAVDGVLPVTETGNQVTLELTEVTDFIQSDPTGAIDAGGQFSFQGVVSVGDATTNVDANGTIEGSFARVTGEIDLDFDFTALGCNVQGTIIGERIDT
ncbi:MAG TPA: hypothetical protein VM737_04260 [Gemmatimonadota bacterium]|nr:hypothetical protein [Gemmatimonadota bacterium]